jgi:hypothetical protein
MGKTQTRPCHYTFQAIYAPPCPHVYPLPPKSTVQSPHCIPEAAKNFFKKSIVQFQHQSTRTRSLPVQIQAWI